MNRCKVSSLFLLALLIVHSNAVVLLLNTAVISANLSLTISSVGVDRAVEFPVTSANPGFTAPVYSTSIIYDMTVDKITQSLSGGATKTYFLDTTTSPLHVATIIQDATVTLGWNSFNISNLTTASMYLSYFSHVSKQYTKIIFK